ncbi:PilC/PilY family type IV pilus protein [Luteimonas sp. MJ204]|uniref:PilC/PilY family type IV pilus protein n=1 Tax=Luteimonas sp. MJ145 TaxID=3129234 RepID=UPI0031BBC547
MKRKTLMRIGAVGSLAAIGIAATLVVKSDPIFLAADSPVPAQVPLYMRDSVPPLNMLVMGKDHKIYYEAYNDASDLDGDGVVDVGYRGWELKSSAPTDGSSAYKIDYYGYFDSYLCYMWNGTEFQPTGGRTINKKCSGYWSGDFLNYATMSRMDALRRVLYGGYRSVDTENKTVLQGAFFPQDAHSWGKEYASVDRDGYDIREYTPLPLPPANRYHLFAVTTRSGNLATYPAYEAPRFRVLRNTTARVWEWVAKEGPVANDSCFNNGNCGVGTGGSAHPGHPANRVAFDALQAAWARPEFLIASSSPSQINCDADCSGVSQNDNHMTVIKGEFHVPSAGRFQFAVDGDDAVDFQLLDGTAVVAQAGWYGGHGNCGTGNCNAYSSEVVDLVGSRTYTIVFRHEEAGGGDNYELRMRQANNSGNFPGNSWGVAPAAAGNNAGLRNLARSTYTLSSGGASFDADKFVRVEACPANAAYRDSICRTYPGGSHKPTGILHDYGERQRMYFGLITGSQANNLQGGVLRRNIENFALEVNATTGQWTEVNGIVRSIDRLRMIGGAYNGGGDNIGHSKNWGWNYSEGGLGGNCESQGHRMIDNGECRMWGNPIAEMMFEGVRYFAGAASPTSAFSSGGSTEGQAEDTRLGLATPTWVDPYRASPAGGGYPACSRPVMTVISDINPSYDGDLPGSAFATVASDSVLPGFNAANLGQEIWNNELGGTRNVFIGDVNGVTDGVPTAKAASSFGNIRGLSPEEPTKGGTYYAASVARYAAWNNLNPLSDYPNMTTFAVALASPLPRMEIPVGDRTVELLPFAMTVSGTFGGETRKPVNTIVDFFVEEIVNFPGGAINISENGGRPHAVFRINYEDVEQGNDHDMDAIVRYTITANSNGTVTVNLDSEYAAGSANQNIGYVISGTTQDGVYLEVRDRDNTTKSSSAYALNTPSGVWAGGCIGQTGSSPCNAGLDFNSTRVFEPGSAGVGERLRDPLWYAAKYGTPKLEPAAAAEPENYFLVTNPLNMRAQLSKAFDLAEDTGLDPGSQNMSGSRVGGGGASFTLQPTFRRDRNGKDWTGNITAYGVNTDATLDAPALWNAAAGIPAYGSRSIYTIHTIGSGEAGSILKSEFSALPGDDDAKLRLLGVNPLDVASRFGGNYSSADFIEYIAGSKENERGQGGTLRERSSVLGSIINSEPIISSPRSNFGYAMHSNSMFSGYEAFLTVKRAADNTHVYFGANDGMLHAFDAGTVPCAGEINRTCAAPGAGQEEFAFIPNGLLNAPESLGNKLGDLALPDDHFNHHYYVDGQLAISDAKDGTDWKTLLAGTTGAGGRSIFMLDVSDPGNFSASSVLWERNDKVDQDIGYLQGKPLIVPLENGSWGVLFGNGFGGNRSDPSLYVLDAFTGSLIKKITADDGAQASESTSVADWICETTFICARKEQPFNGLGQITAIDKNGDGRVDTVYGADLQGNLWKFNLSGSDTTAWKVAFSGEPLFTAEVDGERQPITGGIRVSAGPGAGVMVFFGTGRYQYQPDNTVPENPQLQSLYGIHDNGTYFGATYAEGAPVASVGDNGGRDSLGRQSITSQATAEGQTYRNLSRNVVAYYGPDARRGWYLDLALETSTAGGASIEAQGERFIATPRIQSGRVFLTSYTPLDDSCSPGGLNFVYGLDLLSGAGALSDVKLLGSDEPACTGGACGAVAIGEQSASGAPATQPPVTATSAVAINPVRKIDSTCTGASCATFEQCEVVIYPGAFVLPRPCGRQSWRQLR